MYRIAFLGAGAMGAGMIANLCKAGHGVTVYNRSPDKLAPLLQLGAKAASTPVEAARDAQFVLSMVTNDQASKDIWEGAQGAIHGKCAKDAIFIECSSLSLNRVNAFHEAVQEAGYRSLDCPVAGRPDVAKAGQLTAFAGGQANDIEVATPVLTAFSKRVFHFGKFGAGIKFKLIYNAMGATQIAALAEAMSACHNAGLSLSMASEAFSAGGTGSGHVKLHSRVMALGDYPEPPQFTPAGRLKDLHYAIELASEVGADTSIAQSTAEIFGKMVEAGWEERCDSEVFAFLSGAPVEHG